MTIPTRSQCEALMEHLKMPANIRVHSVLVAKVALHLSTPLTHSGLDLELIEAAALLHDIAKARSLETKENHAELGAAMVESFGHSELAPLIRAHIGLRSYQPGEPLTESLIVNYADKRVRHDLVVDLKERFDDLEARYARSPSDHAMLLEMLARYLQLEADLRALLSSDLFDELYRL